MKLREAVLENTVNNLLKLCQDELGLAELPPIVLLDEPFIQSGNKKSFGEFDGRSIKVITQDRHPVDVMRTLAHELVHWKQQLAGQELNGEDGSDTENTANAIAGVILRKFGRNYPECFVL
jgi:hypothetical protein